MNTQLTSTDYTTITEQVNGQISRLSGQSNGFEIMHNGLLIMVNYEAEYKDVQGGDSYRGTWEMCTELVSESVEITEVWGIEGNEYPEIVEALQLLLN